MKKYPTLTVIPTRREVVQVFGGYNHNLRIPEGEFYDMENLTSDYYPTLSPRSKRYLYKNIRAGGLIEKDSLCYVLNDIENGCAYFYINEHKVEGFTLSYDPQKPIKRLISIGSYVVIMPDKKYINTVNIDDKGSIDNIFEAPSNSAIKYTPCTVTGADIDVLAQPQEPADHSKYWLDTSTTPNALKKYNTVDEKWITVATTYIKIEGAGIADGFSVGDGITLENSIVESINGLNIILAKGNSESTGKSYIVITGLTDSATQQGQLVISRKMPQMDYIVECGNRLWGCFFGYDMETNETRNIIYASKLGDFKNWNVNQTVSTDSYYAEVGTDGQFTGAITHRGYPLFFKENYIHKVYGNYPSNFQIQATACRGVQRGCDRSLAIVNETLFYKSKSGICAFDGSMPQEVSSNLGTVQYGDAVAGAVGYKYYVSMRDSEGRYSTFVLDTQKGLWHREDHLHAAEFCSTDSRLYFIDVDKDYAIWTTSKTENECENDIKWYAITGPIQADTPDKKYISRLTLRLSMKRGSKMRVYIEYDSSDEWEHLYNIDGDRLQSCPIPVIPKRCDHLRLKFEGVGESKLFSICKVIEEGSDE